MIRVLDEDFTIPLDLEHQVWVVSLVGLGLESLFYDLTLYLKLVFFGLNGCGG